MVADTTGLLRVAESLASGGLAFAVGGSGLLYSLGLTDTVRDWDITTDEDMGVVLRTLSAAGLSVRHIDTGDPPFSSVYHLLVETDGTEIDIIGSFSITTDTGACALPTRVSGYLDGVPVGSPEVWAVAYMLMGRHTKADLLDNYLRGNGARASNVDLLLRQPLPHGIIAKVSAWPRANTNG